MNLLLISSRTNYLHSFKTRQLTGCISYSTSYLNKLYETSKEQKTPFFKVDSHHIRIIEDPLDFYLSLIVHFPLNQPRKASRHPPTALA